MQHSNLFVIIKSVEIYFDNPACKRNLQTSEVNWYFNGVNIQKSPKYTIVKQKEVSILLINRISQADCGIYAIQVAGNNSQHIATLKIESKENCPRPNTVLTVIFVFFVAFDDTFQKVYPTIF